MFDNLKISSKYLNATFKITIYLPDDYDKNNYTYNALYIVSGSNLFLNKDYDLEHIIEEKNFVGFAIYPNIDIAKNKLLYNSFNSKYNFAKLYEEFIINELRPLLVTKYRVNDSQKGNAILGIKDTTILAYSLAYHYTNKFDNLLLHEFRIDSIKPFMSDLMSKFDPNIGFHFSMSNTEFKEIISDRLIKFGATSTSTCKEDIKELLKRL